MIVQVFFLIVLLNLYQIFEIVDLNILDIFLDKFEKFFLNSLYFHQHQC